MDVTFDIPILPDDFQSTSDSSLAEFTDTSSPFWQGEYQESHMIPMMEEEQSPPISDPEYVSFDPLDEFQNGSMNFPQVQDECDQEITDSKRGRKRRRKDDDLDELKDEPVPMNESNISRVQLSRDDLLKVSSKQFEDFITQITANLTLTAAEQKEIKRQRRLVRNRESAQASRLRKKENMDVLQQKISQLQNENSQLNKKVAQLEVENNKLRGEVTMFRRQFGNPSQQQTNQKSLSSLESNQQQGKKRTQQLSQNMKRTGVVTLIVLFSFGLFLKMNIQQPVARREQVPEVLSPHMKLHQGRQLLEFKDNSNVRIEKYSYPRMEEFDENKIEEIPKFFETTEAPRESVKDFVNHSLPIADISEFEEDPDLSYWYFNEEKSSPRNTTYLTCSDLKQIPNPPSETSMKTDDPFYITLVVPNHSLNPEMALPSSENETTSVLEITCEVLSVRTVTKPIIS
jgi:regulator of replication initiation timing